jgi:putative NIF3 family GTP cyclohydrolase 1 type 2
MNVKQVVDVIIAACDTAPLTETCDRLIAGDWEAEVAGIVTTFMATTDVIQAAIAKGANLIITHEPTYFTHDDDTDWLDGDPVYALKQKLIAAHDINIWRFHDHMHAARPDMIYAGLDEVLGWADYGIPDNPHCYVIPPTTVEDLSAFLQEKLDVKVARIVGRRAAQVERVGVLVGGGSLGLGSEQMPMELMRDEDLDVIVCGEILEWTLCAYARDADQLGLNKALIILGHNRTEEVGMQHLPRWLETLLPGVPVWFCEAGEPFSYL